MSRPDLNLLYTLEVVLAEGNVARAARRMRLSPSAMSRALARLREATGDPLLVRAGRRLVSTPRALELRERISALVQEGESVLRPTEQINLQRVVRTFKLRTSDGFVENFGPRLLERVSAEAPNVRLHFLQKADKESAPLREGMVDLETGVVEPTTGPELCVQGLFEDRSIAAMRHGHPFAKHGMTPARYAAGRHVLVSRLGDEKGPIDTALAKHGLKRQVVTMVGGFGAALALARATDLIATVPERHTASLRTGMVSLALPFPVPPFRVSLLWHPRLNADPVHRWLRGCIREVCGT